MRSKTLKQAIQKRFGNRYITTSFFAAIVAFVIISCWQLPSWGTAGFAEWQDSTPGGNLIGNMDGPGARGVYLSSKGGVYLDRIVDYGFYDGIVVGISKSTGTEKYFLFHEDTKKIEFFTTKQSLCTEEVNNKFNKSSIPSWFRNISSSDLLVVCFCVWYSICFMVAFFALLDGYLKKHNPAVMSLL